MLVVCEKNVATFSCCDIFKLSFQQHINYLQLYISLYNAIYSWLSEYTAIIMKIGNHDPDVKCQIVVKFVVMCTYQAAMTPGKLHIR